MDDDRNDAERNDDFMLPGFRFHPTDEELVGFYLKRKIQQQTLPIELIKQVDIYKYDPWDLPKLAATGEKEWYFYCPRDRKYKNSARPNRVTGAGFWKATGTDRPIYSSEGTKCIGLKKSLVFYRGRAAKGIKTDWMMHEFRLPSTPETATTLKKPLDKSFSAADPWAICRIFKKTNSITQRALSHTWVTPFPEIGPPDVFTHGAEFTQLHSDNPRQALDVKFSTSFTSSFGNLPGNFAFSGPEISGTTSNCSVDIVSMLYNSNTGLTGDISKTSGSSDFEGPQQQMNSFLISSSQELQESISTNEHENQSTTVHVNDQWPDTQSIGFPFSLDSNLPDTWKPNMPWDSPSCTNEISTNKCHTFNN